MNIIQFNAAAAQFNVRAVRTGGSKVVIFQDKSESETIKIDEFGYYTWKAITHDFTTREVRKFLRRAYKIVENQIAF